MCQGTYTFCNSDITHIPRIYMQLFNDIYPLFYILDLLTPSDILIIKKLTSKFYHKQVQSRDRISICKTCKKGIYLISYMDSQLATCRAQLVWIHISGSLLAMYMYIVNYQLCSYLALFYQLKTVQLMFPCSCFFQIS